MQQSNPVVIPRNHQVEAVISSAVEDNDYAPFEAMLHVVTSPFDAAHDDGPYAQPPSEDEVVTATFCGT